MNRQALLALQLTFEFFDLLQDPRIIGGVLERFLFRLPLPANPIDEGTKQAHVGIQGSQCLRGPATQPGSQKPGLDDRKALRSLLFARVKMNAS